MCVFSLNSVEAKLTASWLQLCTSHQRVVLILSSNTVFFTKCQTFSCHCVYFSITVEKMKTTQWYQICHKLRWVHPKGIDTGRLTTWLFYFLLNRTHWQKRAEKQLMMLCLLLQRWLPDEVQWLVFVPDPPAGPALIQKMSVVLGAVRLNWVSTLITTLLRQKERKSTLQEELYSNYVFWHKLKKKSSHLMRRKSSLVCVVAQ